MPLTPDSELDLLFPAELIPQHIKDQLHPDIHLRPLAADDYYRGHLATLATLTKVSDPGAAAWAGQFQAMRACPGTYYPLVAVLASTDEIVGAAGAFIERKFLRGLGKVAHIEDVAVREAAQGRGLGAKMIKALVGISESIGCYKTILNCSDKNIPFYEKCGFEKKENGMAKYAPERVSTPHL